MTPAQQIGMLVKEIVRLQAMALLAKEAIQTSGICDTCGAERSFDGEQRRADSYTEQPVCQDCFRWLGDMSIAIAYVADQENYNREFRAIGIVV